MAMTRSAVNYDPKTNQYYQNEGYYAPAFGWINGNVKRVNLAPPVQSRAPQQSFSRPQFTPNAFTQSQLSGMGQGATPQWMMDAYSQKIGSMGGNANEPPFSVTQSGFPGMGGKSAPSSGGAAGWRSGGTPMARQG